MIKQLNLYISKKYINAFLSVLLLFFACIFLGEVIEHSRKLKTSGSFSDAVLLAFYFTPKAIDMVYPIIIGAASIITFWQLSYHRELIVMRSHGISIWKLLIPISMIALLIGVIKVILISPLEIKFLKEYSKLRYNITNKSSLYVFDGKTWFIQKEDQGYYLINIDKLNILDKELKGIHITQIVDNKGFVKKIIAEQGKFQQDSWQLENVTLLFADGQHKTVNLYSFETPYNATKIQKSISSPETLSFWDLQKTIQFLEESGLTVTEYQLQYYKLLLQPMTFLAVALFACFFGLKAPRAKQSFIPVLNYAIVIVIYYFMSKFFEAQAKSNLISTEIAISTPILILLLCSISLLIHKEDG